MDLTIACSFDKSDQMTVLGTLTFDLKDGSLDVGTCQSIFAVNEQKEVMAIGYFIEGMLVQDRRSLSEIDSSPVILCSGIDIDLEEFLFQIAIEFYNDPMKVLDPGWEFKIEKKDLPTEVEKALVEWEHNQLGSIQ